MKEIKILIMMLFCIVFSTNSYGAIVIDDVILWKNLTHGENDKAYKNAKLLIKGADSTIAYYVLGELYFRGLVVDRNYLEAVKLWKTAANRGLPMAQNNLGNMYEEGLGVEKDCSTALFWYKKAAQPSTSCPIPELNFPYSACSGLYSLGLLYKNGICVPADQELALKYLKSSTSLGYKPAQKVINDMKTN